ncbi:MAG: hypothetical protein AAF503_11825 [Pseudomonadota bacterium]
MRLALIVTAISLAGPAWAGGQPVRIDVASPYAATQALDLGPDRGTGPACDRRRVAAQTDWAKQGGARLAPEHVQFQKRHDLALQARAMRRVC